MEERRANGPTERQKTATPDRIGLVGNNKEPIIIFEANKMDWQNQTEEVVVSKMPVAQRANSSNLP